MNKTENKIISIEKIGEIIQKQRNNGKTIVTTNGAFDLLHAGHIASLEKAKEQGDILVIGLNSDSSIKKYKSINRPIIPQEYRAKILAALEIVNYVVIFDETDPINFLSKVKTDVHVKSKTGYKGIEKNVVEENGGKIILMDDIPGLSTTNIISKIIEIHEKEN